MVILDVQNLNVHYGVIHALKGISFSVKEGEIVTLIGGNGAGKSTTLRAISGLEGKSDGVVKFLGQNISKLAPHKVVSLGLSQVPEGRRVFPQLTVEDNLFLGAYLRKDKKEIQIDLDKVYLLFPRLKERRKQQAGSLSGGEQQMLAMGRGLMSKPKLLLLDEPSMGLAPMLVRDIFRIIQEINAQGTTILLVEQNANLSLDISDRAYVLETGKITLAGAASELAKDDRIKAAYLGS